METTIKTPKPLKMREFITIYLFLTKFSYYILILMVDKAGLIFDTDIEQVSKSPDKVVSLNFESEED